MTSWLKRREKKVQKVLLPNLCPSSEETFSLCQNNSREASMKRSEHSMMTRKEFKLKESSSLNVPLLRLWNTLITIKWTVLSSNSSRWPKKARINNSGSTRSSWNKLSNSWSTNSYVRESRAKETYSAISHDRCIVIIIIWY